LRDGIARRVWFGEVSLPARDLSEMGFDPGVLGCGVVLCNAGEETLGHVRGLGARLASAYTGVGLPNGRDGSLRFWEGFL
jgi:hypothetical protein